MSDEEDIPIFSEFSEDEYLVPSSSSSRKKKGKTGAPEEYRLTNTLKAPRATTYAASALNEQITRGDIELNPEYQRDIVWTTQKQIGLIDSIFRNFYVPPIIFAATSHEDGSETKICIDGKQRLTSIHLFMTGIIPHREVDTGKSYWFVNTQGRHGEILPERYRTIFSNKQIVCVEYQELKGTDERDIFTRVQLGMALTVAEKLQAISTPRADLIRHLIRTFLTPTTLAHPDIPWDRSRARDFQIVGTAVCMLFKWDKHTGLKAWVSTSTLEKWLGESGTSRKKPTHSRRGDGEEEDTISRIGVPVDEDFKDAIIKTFKTVAELATTKRYSSAFRASNTIAQKVSPIEMTGAFILVHTVHTSPPKTPKNEITLAGLSALYVLLRKKLREEHKDVRLNSRVSRTMFDFCLDASKNPVSTIVEGEDEGLLEGEVEDGARWTKKNNRVSDARRETEHARARAQVETSEEEQLEDEEITIPVKRRRATWGPSVNRASGSTSPLKRRNAEGSPPPTNVEKPAKFSHAALPTPPLPSSPSPLTPSVSIPLSTPQVPTPEQLLASMGVSVSPEMIPSMIAQMKSFAQGATQTRSAVKDEGEDSAGRGFAADVARGIGRGFI